MKLEEIQNPALEKLIGDLKHASSTIENDFNDALEKSSTEKELIEYWQSALMDLYNECQHFWGILEALKPKEEINLHKLIAEGRAPPPGVIYPDRCNATKPHENREGIVHRCELPKGHEGKHQCIFCRYKWDNQKSKLNIEALKTVKFSEPDPRSLRY